MKTIRMLRCPVCDQSVTQPSLAQRTAGRFKVDVRACGGRKGLPHIAWEDLAPDERELLRLRLLSALKGALERDIVTLTDIEFLVPAKVSTAQIPLSMDFQPSHGREL
jgi:hypothetical protein